MLEEQMSQLPTCETILEELKLIMIVPELHQQQELNESDYQSIVDKNEFDRLIPIIENNFSNFLSNILPKYIAISFNTPEIINNSFTIYFGITDNGRSAGYPIKNIEDHVKKIKNIVIASLLQVLESSMVKYKDGVMTDAQPIGMRGLCATSDDDKSITYSYTHSDTHYVNFSDTDNLTNNLVDLALKYINFDINLTPITELKIDQLDTEPEFYDIVEKYKKKKALHDDLTEKKNNLQAMWHKLTSYVKPSILHILSDDRRYEFIIWLKYVAKKEIVDIYGQYPDLDILIQELEKKTNDRYDEILVDCKLLRSTDISSDKLMEYHILKLITTYRDSLCEQLRKDAHLYKTSPIIQMSTEPYKNIFSCYIESAMKEIEKKTCPLYVSSIKISNIKQFLENVNIEHFYYENDSGILTCQERVIAVVSNKGCGPISIDKKI